MVAMAVAEAGVRAERALLGWSRREQLLRMDEIAEAEVKVAEAAWVLQEGTWREARAAERLVGAGCRREERAAAQARVAAAAAALRATEADVAALVLRSPMDGWVVDAVPEERVGWYLEAGEVLLTLHGDEGWIAELGPEWMFAGARAGGLRVKLVLASGQVLWSEVARELPRSLGRGGAVLPGPRLETPVLRVSGLASGLTGRARIYGPAVSLVSEYVWHPLARRVGLELWTAL